MLTATGLVESWDQTPVGPAVDGRETLPIDLSGPHWDTPPLPEWIDPATLPPPPYTPLDGSRVAPLDGMRAFAVTAVILYHANPSWAVGGYFGVDVFFVLSGFLITTLLLGEWRGSGGVGLRAFWGRRARRLLPALFVMLAVVGTVSVLAPRVLGSPGLLGDTLATVGYVANWHFIFLHTDYFATVANPSPLQHTWTLAIEEQFYLLWPLILLALVGGFRRLRRPSGAAGRRRSALVAGVALAGAVASALTMAVLTPVGATSVNRSYYGSDTRAQGLLIGAALAALCLWWGPVRTSAGRRLLGVVGLAGALGVLVMWRTVPESSALTFHGGFAPAGPGHGRGDRLRHAAGPASGGRTPLRATPALPGEDLLRDVPLVLARPARHDVAADPPPGSGPAGGPPGGHRGRGRPLLPPGRVPDPPGPAGRLAIVGGRPAGRPGRLPAPPPDAVRLGRGAAGDGGPTGGVEGGPRPCRHARPGGRGRAGLPTGAHPLGG